MLAAVWEGSAMRIMLPLVKRSLLMMVGGDLIFGFGPRVGVKVSVILAQFLKESVA